MALKLKMIKYYYVSAPEIFTENVWIITTRLKNFIIMTTFFVIFVDVIKIIKFCIMNVKIMILFVLLQDKSRNLLLNF